MMIELETLDLSERGFPQPLLSKEEQIKMIVKEALEEASPEFDKKFKRFIIGGQGMFLEALDKKLKEDFKHPSIPPPLDGIKTISYYEKPKNTKHYSKRYVKKRKR